MKIIQTIRKNLTMMGIEPMQSTQIRPFNAKLSFGFLLYCLHFIANVLYLIDDAKTILEYLLCFGIICAAIGFGLCLAILAWKKVQLYNYIESIEKLIDNSEYSENKYIQYPIRSKSIEKLLKKINKVKLMLRVF